MKILNRILCTVFLVAGLEWVVASKPNVILVITDDQGYGDVGAHGNAMIRTPNMDRLWSESVRLTDFHVDPTCSPTRAALMSGRYSNRSGVWHTIMGRSLMHPDELTLAEVFQSAGYRTGMFGKWHLGDNYPLRPEDQGFEYTVRHGGGGVGQGPDFWDNDYFDDTYWRNGEPEKFNGYCTDVWFEEAIAFVERNRNEPFFCYLSTNAPHGPLFIAEKYWKPYHSQGVPENMARFYGMIENIDDNLGRLRRRLKEFGLDRNTILIFMTDNGSANALARARDEGVWRGFNAGLRGLKGSEYEGGHKVPFFMHWPDGALNEGRDVNQLTAHIDVLPTLIDLCEIEKPEGPPVDGQSLKPILYGDKTALRDRTLFVHSQRIAYPEPWRKTAVMTEDWRLVNGNELYFIKTDPGQTTNLIGQHPKVRDTLTDEYEMWWESLKPSFKDYVRIGLGSSAENPVNLMSHDWVVEEQNQCSWRQNHVRNGHEATGPWAVNIERAGVYQIELYRWPKHLDRPANGLHARVRIGDVSLAQGMQRDDTVATFRCYLPEGPALLQTWMRDVDGTERGAYFTSVHAEGDFNVPR